jgi:hypothetical protein
MAAKTQNRKHGIIDRLDLDLREAVEQMLVANCTYSDVVDFLAQHGVSISIDSVFRYARGYKASMDLLQVAGENFRRMTEAMANTPNLDMGEALMRVASQHVMTALTQLDHGQLSKVDFIDLIHETSALTKVISYKKNVDASVRGKVEAALAELQQTFADTMAVEDPEAYKKLDAYFERKRAEIRVQAGG